MTKSNKDQLSYFQDQGPRYNKEVKHFFACKRWSYKQRQPELFVLRPTWAACIKQWMLILGSEILWMIYMFYYQLPIEIEITKNVSKWLGKAVLAATLMNVLLILTLLGLIEGLSGEY